MSKTMIVFIIFIVAVIAAGGVFLHMVKQSGMREYEQKQEVAAAEREAKAKKVIIEVNTAPIAKIKDIMKNKYTRD
jgi:flagellar basal body-associated protein FliL